MQRDLHETLNHGLFVYINARLEYFISDPLALLFSWIICTDWMQEMPLIYNYGYC